MLLGWIFQWLVLPQTAWHAGNGLMAGGDWVAFFSQAQELASRIREHGWQMWEVRYEGQWPASLMAAVFALTGWEHPSVVLPIYAAVYGVAAGFFAAAMALWGWSGYWRWWALAVFALPSTVLIYGQPHKDVFALCGMAFLVWSWSHAWLGFSKWRWLKVALGVFVAFGLWWLPRPYLCEVALVALAIGIIAGVGASRDRLAFAAKGAVYLSLAASVVLLIKAVQVKQVEQVGLCESWRPEKSIPFLHEKVGRLLCYRHGFIAGYSGAASNIDFDRQITNYHELVSYIPRAAALGLIVPVPKWCAFTGQCQVTSPGGELKRLVASIEMLVFYGVLLGCLFLLRIAENEQSSFALAVFTFAWAIAVFYVLTSPNEGALYRLRFPEIALWWCLGAWGWGQYASSHLAAGARKSSNA